MAFDPRGLVCYVNGEYVPGEAAGVSIFDHGFLYGDGIFEGIRLFSHQIFRWPDHCARMRGSLAAMQIEIDETDDELLDIVKAVVIRSKLTDADIRVLVTRGFGAPTLDPVRRERPSIIVAAYPFPPILGTDPIRLALASVVRKAPMSMPSHVKSLNYIDSILARQGATRVGADDAVMLDYLGAMAECSTANIFFVINGELSTPTTRSALPGITRKTVIEVAAERRIRCSERDIWPSELDQVSACFITGSGAGVVPVRSIDSFQFDSGDHPIVTAVIDGYRARTADARYLTPVE